MWPGIYNAGQILVSFIVAICQAVIRNVIYVNWKYNKLENTIGALPSCIHYIYCMWRLVPVCTVCCFLFIFYVSCLVFFLMMDRFNDTTAFNAN